MPFGGALDFLQELIELRLPDAILLQGSRFVVHKHHAAVAAAGRPEVGVLSHFRPAKASIKRVEKEIVHRCSC